MRQSLKASHRKSTANETEFSIEKFSKIYRVQHECKRLVQMRMIRKIAELLDSNLNRWSRFSFLCHSFLSRNSKEWRTLTWSISLAPTDGQRWVSRHVGAIPPGSPLLARTCSRYPTPYMCKCTLKEVLEHFKWSRVLILMLVSTIYRTLSLHLYVLLYCLES